MICPPQGNTFKLCDFGSCVEGPQPCTTKAQRNSLQERVAKCVTQGVLIDVHLSNQIHIMRVHRLDAYVYIHMHANAHKCTCTYICKDSHAPTTTHIRMADKHVQMVLHYTRTHMRTHTYAQMHLMQSKNTHAPTHTCMHTHTPKYHTSTYIYTRTRTCPDAPLRAIERPKWSTCSWSNKSMRNRTAG